MTEHTSTPWLFRSEKTKALLYADNGDWLGDIATDDDAAFIVQCVNSHAALVAALKAVEWESNWDGWRVCPMCQAFKDTGTHAPACQLFAALRAADGE